MEVLSGIEDERVIYTLNTYILIKVKKKIIKRKVSVGFFDYINIKSIEWVLRFFRNKPFILSSLWKKKEQYMVTPFINSSQITNRNISLRRIFLKSHIYRLELDE